MRWPHEIPVIILSAYSDQTRTDEAREVSPYGFITKPVIDDRLLVLIERSLAQRRP